MPRFSEYFNLGLSQHELDFVDVSNTFDTPVYVDPYAIEIQDDVWCAEASENIRTFFTEVLNAIRAGDIQRASNLMSHLTEPKETFLGVSKDDPRGRGVGRRQAGQLIEAIRSSKAYQTGLLADLSDMALYVEGVDRDKISDLTTNIIRNLLVDYTQQQCELHGVETLTYAGPALWDRQRHNWVARHVQLPQMDDQPVLLVPKYIVRRSLSINSQDFYNRQITDFLVSENLKANSALVQTVRGAPKVYKGAVREAYPKSKSFIAEMVAHHPALLDLYKEVARKQGALLNFDDGDGPTITAVCGHLASAFARIPPGREHANDYHNLILGSMTALFYPLLNQPHKEWDIHDGRKRIDIVFTNSGERGFFAQRRDDTNTHANVVIVECKNYSKDIANPELDQLIGRFDGQRGRLGIVTCRSIDDREALLRRCRDAAARAQGYMIILTDNDFVTMLRAKSELEDSQIDKLLHEKYRELLA